ncbi:tetratricopeptide repeat protein [Roseomonas sp. CECT 9278]|uniref:tetratricopeptide repeat protein n=1 Tax=Roseomonas sp. CECT 9278 TaxID=2845823 RepID=UPI001E4C3E9C|nr:tetratricopeptide repeat protein [Roseomonas sp. CECT 9278]CAH0306237.1 Beta-barrel assembly-enhancing protease [Roseomonas sp. CECT 9278]
MGEGGATHGAPPDEPFDANALRQRLARNPAAAPLHADFVWALMQLGQLDEAEQACRAALERFPERAELLMRLGIIARRRGDRVGAAAQFQAVLNANPGHAVASLELAWDLLHLGALDEAEAVCCALLASDPRNAQAHIRLGLVARARGELEIALNAFEMALGLAPGDRWATQEIAWTRGELEARQATAPPPPSPAPPVPSPVVATLRAALSGARRGGDAAAVVAALRALLPADPTDAAIHAELAWKLLQLGRVEEADEACRAALARFPDDADILVRHAVVARRQGDRDGAITRCRAALAQRPTHSWGSLELAANLTDAGQLDEAERVCEALLAAEPGNAQAHIRRGLIQRRRGDANGAAASFGTAAQLDPANTWAKLELAGTLVELDRADEATGVLNALLAAEPGHVEVLRRLGLARRRMGDAAGARASFAAALEAEPDSVAVMIELAREERSLGHLAEAGRLLQAALECAPDNLTALHELIQWHAWGGDAEAATAICRRAIEAHPREAWLHAMLCRLLAESSATEEAAMTLAAALERFGPVPALIEQQVLRLRQRGEPAAARAALHSLAGDFLRTDFAMWYQDREIDLQLGDLVAATAAMDSAPPPERSWEKAQFHMLQGRIASAGWDLAAAETAFTAAAARGDHPPAHEELARMALLRFDRSAARAELKSWTAATARAERRPAPRNIGATFQGQLLHEFELDRATATEISRLREEARPSRIEALRRLVRANPDQTLGAIALLVELRLSGMLPAVTAEVAHASVARRIPRQIAQFWAQGEPDADLIPMMQSWEAAHPDHAYRRFDTASALAFLRENCAPEVARAFREAREAAQAADIFRLAWLTVEGGVWADADDRCLAPLSGLIHPETTLLGYQEDFGSIANNVLAAAPGHPAVTAALRDAVTSVLRGDQDMIWLATGPGLLSRCFARHLAILPEQPEAALRDTRIATRAEMQRCVAMFCAAGYKQTKRSWSRRAFGP